MNTLTPILSFGMILVAVVMGIPTLIGMWKVFAKAGQPGWAVLIPVYNFIILLRIAGLRWYWVFTLLIVPILILVILGLIAYLALVGLVLVLGFGAQYVPAYAIQEAAAYGDRLLELALIAGFVMILFAAWMVWVHHRISTRFGQGVGFAIGLVLLAPIFWLILGFGSSKYVAEQPAQA
jgi:hypothetical protein